MAGITIGAGIAVVATCSTTSAMSCGAIIAVTLAAIAGTAMPWTTMTTGAACRGARRSSVTARRGAARRASTC